MIPTMISQAEQAFYVWLTRECCADLGAVVDLGAFAGGSTACLAEGLRQAGRKQIVHGYDKFLVNDFNVFRRRYHTYLADLPARDADFPPRGLPEIQGDDLLPVVRHFLAPWGDRIVLHKGLIEDQTWQAGPVELLVMDASKTAKSMHEMSRLFFPHLIAGRSIVVQQDFLWWQQPWIAAQMAVLSDYFEPIAHVAPMSVSFLYTKHMPPEMLEQANIVTMTDDQLVGHLRAMKQSVKRFRIDRLMRRLISAVRANPEARQAFHFRNRPDGFFT
ncbi:hypothetical protein AB9K34_00500 [Sedimentitalea sp. XS_ASV28]|uniref:hypothetical protein n=1 Tax=Sedimentitalea sp. XS_ASV28 TaxID=3241296 RepID=UPI0035134E92